MIIDLIGDVLWDTHLAVPHLPTPGREARATSRRHLLGGTASHVARWLHLLAEAGLYASTPPAIRLWAVLDVEAASALASCDTSACPLAPQISEVYALTRPDGEKAMISLVPPDLPPRPLPPTSTFFYLSAYMLLAPDARERIVEPCERLIAQGAQMVFDLAPLAHQMESALAQRLIGRARVALGNDVEWLEVFKASSSEETIQAALALGASSVHIKRGEHGSILARADGSHAEMPAAPCHPVNSTGAGDAYTAAALAALVAGHSDHWAQRLATFCGALHTEQRPDSENIAALRHFLASSER
ncbi:MAG TPA: carbohydrate kinase family protein [Ktedonobacterales bacterium]|nr:carbohydrate kinase family protein [Ktedonobacterales bacterium]